MFHNNEECACANLQKNRTINLKIFLGDGKCVGPTRRKTKHLKELGKSSQDNRILQRGSKYLDRLFIKKKKERDFANQLLHDEITAEDVWTGSLPVDTFINLQT